jgi:hypothetical protein
MVALTSLWSELVNAIIKKVMATLEVDLEFVFIRRSGERVTCGDVT